MASWNASTSNSHSYDVSDISNNSTYGDSFEDAECSEDLENYLKKLEELKKRCFEKNVENTLLKRCIEHKGVAEFLNDVFSSREHRKNPISKKERRYIKQLLKENKKMNKTASGISKENRELEKEIIIKKVHLRDSMLERKKSWNEAAKIFMFTTGNLAEFEDLDVSEECYETVAHDQQETKENQLKILHHAIAAKSHRILELSRILHSLIGFSGVPWANNKNLLEVLLCTGKILESNFDIGNQKELRKVVDEIIHRLNLVEI